MDGKLCSIFLFYYHSITKRYYFAITALLRLPIIRKQNNTALKLVLQRINNPTRLNIIQFCYLMKGIYTHSICTLSRPISPMAMGKVTRIRDILGRALGEIRNEMKRNQFKSPLKRLSDASSQSDTIQEVLANLKKGYMMIKHSQNKNEQRDKFIYLSGDQRFICWKSFDKDNEKKIQITDIDKVIKEGAEFYLRSTTIGDISRCLIIVAGDTRLQLEARNQLEAEYFRYQINRVIKYWKGMRLNYKYTKPN